MLTYIPSHLYLCEYIILTYIVVDRSPGSGSTCLVQFVQAPSLRVSKQSFGAELYLPRYLGILVYVLHAWAEKSFQLTYTET